MKSRIIKHKCSNHQSACFAEKSIIYFGNLIKRKSVKKILHNIICVEKDLSTKWKAKGERNWLHMILDLFNLD